MLSQQTLLKSRVDLIGESPFIGAFFCPLKRRLKFGQFTAIIQPFRQHPDSLFATIRFTQRFNFMSSLQDQLLKAGLTTKDKANKAKSAKRKQQKVARKHKVDSVDENKLAAEKALAEKAERDRLLNLEKNAKAEEKAVAAQIRQLIESNKQDLGKPVITFNFSDNGAIKKLEVSNEVHRHLTNGQLAIAREDTQYALVPKPVAEKIMQRSQDYIVVLHETVDQVEEDDPYADYQIPDDLMW